MLSQPMINQLNKQINLEMYSSNLYLQMSSWCAHKGLDGCAQFLSQHADEENMHMRKLFTYLHETGALAILGSIAAPPFEFNSLKDIFTKIYDHELQVTKSINELVHLAKSEPDYSTFNFLQWYVAEQHQEEFLFKTILSKIEIIGTEGQGVFFIDREIGQMAATGAKGTPSVSG